VIYLVIYSVSGGRFTKGVGALFSVQSIPEFPPKWFSETVPRILGKNKTSPDIAHVCRLCGKSFSEGNI
jgi:hypothetical protein